MSNQLQEIYSLLVKWAKKWTRGWWVYHAVGIAAMVAIVALTSYYCNYIYGVAEDKSVILYWLVLFLVVSVIYLFCLWREDKKSFKWLAIIIMLTIAVLGAWDAYHCECFVGKDSPITLHYLVGFLLTTATIYLIWRRTVNQEEQTKSQEKQIANQEKQIVSQEEQIKIQTKQLDIQIKKEVDDRFTAAVNLLGSSETSARTGAIYSLYQQAVDDKKYRVQIVQILCSHIRSKTQEKKYRKHYKTRPSNEIQTTIDVLFRETDSAAGLYPQFRKDLPNANLSYAYCVGANFWRAYCKEVNFRGAHFQGAKFGGADCQNAKFWETHCEGAYFEQTYCKKADFMRAHCQGATFWGDKFEGTTFWMANCQGANLGIIHYRGTQFEKTHCEGAYSSIDFRSLEERIGKDTELQPVQEGALSEEEKHNGLPAGIISGVLEDSDELQRIIKLLKEIREG